MIDQRSPEILFIENPRRKKRHRKSSHRKDVMPAGVRRYLAAKRRSRTSVNAPRRRRRTIRHASASVGGKKVHTVLIQNRSHSMEHRKHRRRSYRHNPPLSLGAVKSQFFNSTQMAALGVGGIFVVNWITNLIIGQFPTLASYKQYLRIAIAAVGLPMLAKYVPGKMGGYVKKGSEFATAYAIFLVIQQFLPATITAGLSGEDSSFPSQPTNYLGAGEPAPVLNESSYPPTMVN
jgi:hypothetical protein